MYFLKVKADFSAALYLSGSDGIYRGMHGHDFSVLLTLSSSNLIDAGMVYDYNSVKETLENITNSLDHVLLNDQSEFIEKNPTVEHVAKYVYDQLMLALSDLPVFEVEVSQCKGFSACYRPNA